MANLKVVLEIDNQGYIRGIKAADSATKDFANDSIAAFKRTEQSMVQLSQRTDGLAQGFGKLRSAIAGVAIGAFIGKAIVGADAISDLSDATDLSIGKLLEFEKALIAAGGKGDDAAKAITGFYDSIQQANSGSDKTQEQFAKLGVSLNDLKTLNESDLLDKSLKGFKNLTDPVLKSTIAVDLFTKAFKTVDPNKLSSELEKLKGTLAEQEKATLAAAQAIERFDKFIGNLRGAVVLAIEPLLKYFGLMEGSVVSTEKLASTLKTLLSIYVALKVAIVTNIVAQAALNGLMSAGMAKSPAAAGLALAAAGLAGSLAYEELNKILGNVEKQAGKTTNAVNNGLNTGSGPRTPAPAKNRAQETGKELQGQLNAVNSLADGYRRTAQASMDRLTTEVELLGKSKEEQETVKATAEINKRYADQTAALEQKKAGAKGATLALINKEIANLEDLRTSELDVYNITREQTVQYARQQQEVKNIVDLMEQMAQYQAEIAGFQTQQDAARTSAFEQVRAQREAFELLGQREQLEKSIQNLRGSDQDNIKKLFDLEQQRKTQLEAIQKIQNLPFEGVGGMKERLQEINDLYDERRAQIEATAAATQIEQDSFSEGWSNAFEKFRNNIKTDSEYAAQQFSNFTKGFEDAIVKFVQTGKLSFKDLANSIIAEFAKIQAQKMFVSLFGGATGGGILGSLFGGLFGIGKAGGGPVMAGKPYMVGESGREMFVPNSAGSIIPNNQLGGGVGSTAVTYNIQAVDAASFRSLVARDPSFIYAVTEQGRRSQPTRSR